MGNQQQSSVKNIVENVIDTHMSTSQRSSQTTFASQKLKIGCDNGGPTKISIGNSNNVSIGTQKAVVDMSSLQKMLQDASFASQLSTTLKSSIDNKQVSGFVPSVNNSNTNVENVVKHTIKNTIETSNEAIQAAIVKQEQDLCIDVVIDNSSNINLGVQEQKVLNKLSQDLQNKLVQNNIMQSKSDVSVKTSQMDALSAMFSMFGIIPIIIISIVVVLGGAYFYSQSGTEGGRHSILEGTSNFPSESEHLLSMSSGMIEGGGAKVPGKYGSIMDYIMDSPAKKPAASVDIPEEPVEEEVPPPTVEAESEAETEAETEAEAETAPVVDETPKSKPKFPEAVNYIMDDENESGSPAAKGGNPTYINEGPQGWGKWPRPHSSGMGHSPLVYAQDRGPPKTS